MASRAHTFAWVAVLALGLLMVLGGLFILTEPVEADDFQRETGIAWSEFEDSQPEAATYLVREARLLAVSFAVLGFVAAAMGATLLRSGDRIAWRITWFLPLAFAGTATVFFTTDAVVLGMFYAAGTLVAVVVTATGMLSARSR